MKLINQELLRDRFFINNEWCEADDKSVIGVFNPANNNKIIDIACAGTNETKKAIDAAYHALPQWQLLSPKVRGKYLLDFRRLILENIDDLAMILTCEMGKPLGDARGEIIYGANYLEWFAEEGKRAYGDIIPTNSPDKRVSVIKQAVGVAACITPWNFPSAMLTRKIAPALAAGCTIVCKPANETPLSAYALMFLAQRAEIPAGVINMVSGNTKEIGHVLTSSPKVKKLSFTGSTKTGILLAKQCASTVKRLSMELGGNAPFIVFEDADIDNAINSVVKCKYRNSGQTCVCANRIFVHASIYESFTQKLRAKLSDIKMGDGIEVGVNFGPIISKQAKVAILELVESAKLDGGKEVSNSNDGNGNFLPPKILVDVPTTSAIFREEIFGPVAVLYRFDTDEEVLKLANDSQYGLAAYFFTQNYQRIIKFSEQLEYGMVGVNEGIISNEMAPFGGIKQSGYGREGSKYGLDDYLSVKYICLGGIE